MAEIVTHEMIDYLKSGANGWTKKNLAWLGVPWPPISGWKDRIIGKPRIEVAIAPKQKRQKKHKKRRRPVDYKAYINSAEWKEKRRLVFRKQGRKCTDCGKTSELQVHHKTYERLGHERLSDLEVLCRQCHANCHPEHQM